MNGINPKTTRIFLTKLIALGAIALIFGIGETIHRGCATEPEPNPENAPFDSRDCIKCYVAYPKIAKQQGIEGTVEVAFDVNNNGNPINIRLVRSSGSRELDDALIQQVPNFQLDPKSAGRKNIRLTVNFSIKK
ncbi:MULTISPECIES: energy transducer TonB [Nostocales]|uniref:Energy transducer TonB n=3 Tax=Nostocales TaxID=1161 RepID=A0A0C1R2S2_9CYAN|nr:energy transducer TonB [Tolypothrix bouteillei]KAF3890112.1 energy transducer TonB [Tolypothrix bouteillei VB521301]